MPITYAEPQDINHTPLGNLTLQAIQKFGAFGCIFTQWKRFKGLGLGYRYKLNQFGKVNGVFAVVVFGIALRITGFIY